MRRRGHRGDTIGTTRERLAGMLGALGIKIAPRDLQTNEGATIYNDEISWDGWGLRENGLSVRVCSFDSMTRIVRRREVGIVDDDGNTIEVC